MTITTPNGFKIGPPILEIRGLSKSPLGLNNPVGCFQGFTKSFLGNSTGWLAILQL